MRLEAYYIVGFADGEGTFNLVKYPDGRIRPQFLVFNTNKEILNSIKETLGINAPIFEVFRIKDLIKRRQKCYRLQARSEEDIRKVILFFDKNPPIIKKENYRIFKEAYKDWIYIKDGNV
jgi:hypothetical protein